MPSSCSWSLVFKVLDPQFLKTIKVPTHLLAKNPYEDQAHRLFDAEKKEVETRQNEIKKQKAKKRKLETIYENQYQEHSSNYGYATNEANYPIKLPVTDFQQTQQHFCENQSKF